VTGAYSNWYDIKHKINPSTEQVPVAHVQGQWQSDGHDTNTTDVITEHYVFWFLQSTEVKQFPATSVHCCTFYFVSFLVEVKVGDISSFHFWQRKVSSHWKLCPYSVNIQNKLKSVYFRPTDKDCIDDNVLLVVSKLRHLIKRVKVVRHIVHYS